MFLDSDEPVIFIYGKISGQYIPKAYDVGAIDYLIKPIELKEQGINCVTMWTLNRNKKANMDK